MLTPDQIRQLSEAAAEAGQPGPLLRALEAVAAATIAPSLFTVMLFDEPRMEVERLHSSNPAAYPPGGRKSKRETPWGEHVLAQRRVFVGEGEAAIRKSFDDHALILDLGLRSVVNVPVTFDGRCLGTLNFLWSGPKVSEADVAAARLLGLVAAPALRSG